LERATGRLPREEQESSLMSRTTEPVASTEPNPSAAAKSQWPRIALVTPVRNSGKYLEATIRSVLAQNYPNLDYFIVDGGSTDATLDIIRKYESQITGWLSESDNGMYDAVNKGFARTTGEIMGWISATDMLQLGGLTVVGSVFRDLPEVEWITGRTTAYSDEGMTFEVKPVPHWSRYRFLAGANQFIQQESTFWRRSLWEKAGARTDSSYRGGADFELWIRFFRHARLYPVDALIGGFRCHPDSAGLKHMGDWERLHLEFIEAELSGISLPTWLKLYRFVNRAVARIPRIRVWWKNLTRHALYHLSASDWPPVIEYQNGAWRMRSR
jgi:glycosyltransferase involved in cell wall biosynthesis